MSADVITFPGSSLETKELAGRAFVRVKPSPRFPGAFEVQTPCDGSWRTKAVLLTRQEADMFAREYTEERACCDWDDGDEIPF